MSRHYENIVIGGNLEALAYAFVNNFSVLYTELSEPFEFDYVPFGLELGALGSLPSTNLSTNFGSLKVGPSKMQIWQKLLFSMSMAGKGIYGDTINTIDINDGDLIINCFGTKNRILSYDKLIVFDERGLRGLPEITGQTKKKNIVYDWVNINSGGKHDYDLFSYKDDFVNKVYFYSSRRSDNSKSKDLVSVSYLTDEQLVDFSYSETYVKFKLLELFRELGLRGARNGRDSQRPGHYKYYAVKLTPADRQVRSSVENNYKLDDSVVFNNMTFEDILKQPYALDGYLKRVVEAL